MKPDHGAEPLSWKEKVVMWLMNTKNVSRGGKDD